KRLQDEDGAIFIEVRGKQNALFRVIEGNRVYYKLDKAMIEEEALVLLDDFTGREPEPEEPEPEDLVLMNTELPMQSVQLNVGSPYEDDNSEDSQTFDLSTDSFDTGSGTETQKHIDSREIEKKGIELEEGEVVPRHLQAKCKKNEYGGYSLRYNRFLYILDSDLVVEVKTPDTASSYLDQEQTEEIEQGGSNLDVTTDSIPDVSDIAAEIGVSVETGVKTDKIVLTESEAQRAANIPILQKGDILPSSMRNQCEEDISGGGSRISLGHYIYILDPDYRVTVRMGVSFNEAEAPKSEPPVKENRVSSAAYAPEAAAPEPRKIKAPPPKPKKLPVKEIVSNIVKGFSMALDKCNISADFFSDSVLASHNRQTLILAYGGDLAHLNEDTSAATAMGKMTVLLKGGGFHLFKAALIHELYIKSTMAGRGDNMKYFLTYILSLKADGKMIPPPNDMPPEEQQSLLAFFAGKSRVYDDKADIIRRVHRQIRNSIFDVYNQLKQEKEAVNFKALLIAKLYEHTTRLDRGDGITMIRLTKDIMIWPEDNR
ncbi:MAG: hypothetical protein GY757_57540, partial [bacterium]|nr:hypothetical protein [bacterium]